MEEDIIRAVHQRLSDDSIHARLTKIKEPVIGWYGAMFVGPYGSERYNREVETWHAEIAEVAKHKPLWDITYDDPESGS